MPLGFCLWDPRGERAEHVIKVDAALDHGLDRADVLGAFARHDVVVCCQL